MNTSPLEPSSFCVNYASFPYTMNLQFLYDQEKLDTMYPR